MKRIILALLVGTMMAGCGWKYNCTDTRSYRLGEERTSTVGSPIIQTGCFAAECKQSGLNRFVRSRDPYVSESFNPSIESELIYSGREGNILHIMYREYSWEGMARQPFFQQLFYDVNASKSIMFQNWVIDVLEATNQRIKFKVVGEPPRPAAYFLSEVCN